MYNTIGGYSQAARKGVGGLISGLDTDNLVKGMTAATRNKIAKLMQDQQSISWRMDAYRSVSSKLIGFSDKFMSFSSPTNIFSEKFFEGSTITSNGANGKYISATGAVASINGMSITDITSIATAAIFNGTQALSKGHFTSGELDFSVDGKSYNEFAGETLNISYGGKMYNLTIDKDFTGTGAGGTITGEDVANAFTQKLQETKIDDTTTLADKMYIKFEDNKFKINASDRRDDKVLEISGGSNRILALMKIKEGTYTKGTENYTITSSSNVDSSKFLRNVNFNDALKNQSLAFNLDGVTKTFSFDNPAFTNATDFKNAMQSKLDDAFGTGKVKVEVDGDSLKFSTNNPTSKITYVTATGDVAGFKGILGLENNTASKVNIAQSFKNSEFGRALTYDANGKGILKINGVEFEYDENTAIKDLMSDINNSKAGVKVSYLSTTDTFSIVSTETGTQGKIDVSNVSGNLSDVLFGGDNIAPTQAGTDAIIKVKQNGQTFEIVRSTNTFEVNGLNLTLSPDALNFNAADGEVTFTGKANTDDIVKNVKAMVEEYNSMVEFFNTQLATKPDRKYTPLTDEQKEQMTEEQIKNWEEQAQKGILFADPDLRSLTSELRFAFSFNVEGVTSTLKDIGITTSSSYRDNGKIVFDEEAFKKALEEKPDDVKQIFLHEPEDGNKKAEGLMQKMEGIIKKYAGTVGEKGLFIQKAGLKDSMTALDSTMFKQMEKNEEAIKTWKKRLLSEETRYYAQFTRLEQYMQQMNAQSSWLTQQTQ